MDTIFLFKKLNKILVFISWWKSNVQFLLCIVCLYFIFYVLFLISLFSYFYIKRKKWVTLNILINILNLYFFISVVYFQFILKDVSLYYSFVDLLFEIIWYVILFWIIDNHHGVCIKLSGKNMKLLKVERTKVKIHQKHPHPFS